jgi:hypothetical protein
LDFKVSFIGAKSHFASRTQTQVIARFGERAAKSKAKAVVAPIKAYYDNGTINPLYADALRRAAQSRAFEGALKEEQGLVLAQATHKGITLTALVEPTKHTVKNIAYQGGATEVQRGLLEALCQLMVGKPILECSDHAVIFLEFELRDHSLPRPVPGIVTPENADAMFALPTGLVRALLADYRNKTGFKSTENFYDQPISEQWRVLSADERMKQVQNAISQHPDGEGVTVMQLETPKRVVVGFRDALDAATKQDRLMMLEDHLKRTLEPTLQLYMEPRPDANRIRRLKEGSAS